MESFYDVAIIGGGCAGTFAAYELTEQNPALRVIVLDSGKDIYHRSCPIVEKKTDGCVHCNPCSIMHGFGGAGAFSDGKFNFTAQFGGWLSDYLSETEVLKLINNVDQINLKHGAPPEVFGTECSSLGRTAIGCGLHLIDAKVRHLGTENNVKMLISIYEFLKDRVAFRFECPVQTIEKEQECVLRLKNGDEIRSSYLIIAPGRAGSEWFSDECKRLELELFNNQVDVGVRVELPADVFDHITDEVYEAKMYYRTKQYGDLVRTFCMNPKGYVATENTNGIVTVNGHSYYDKALQSKNTNFALLVSNKFTKPFNEPHQYGKRIASLSNMLGGGVLVQRFGDLLKGRRTNEHRLAQSFTVPTLKATPGDLSLVLPKRHLDNIIEMIYQLDRIAPGTANDDTLLYGVEVKFYSARLRLSKELETEIPNFFAIGDGAGVTRGLSQAGASGVYVARTILARLQNDANHGG